MPFQESVNICFKERMDQIVTDPKEFGKVILKEIRRNHCLPEVDLKERRQNMSQQAVLQLLQELGDIATSSEIIILAREKYLDLSLWQYYVSDRLRKLKNGVLLNITHKLASISL